MLGRTARNNRRSLLAPVVRPPRRPGVLAVGVLGALLGLAALARPARAQAFANNTTMALQPGEGAMFYRTQFRWLADDGPAAKGAPDVDRVIQLHAAVYGFSSSFSTLVVVPTVYRRLDPLGMPASGDAGVGDLRVIARYQVYKALGPLKSTTLTLLLGPEVPSFDAPFSARSLDLIAGLAFSVRDNRHALDTDAFFQVIPENDLGVNAPDVLRLDAAYQYRLWPSTYAADGAWSFAAMFEINGEFAGVASGVAATRRNELFIAPALTLGGYWVTVQLGVQIPVWQDVGPQASMAQWRIVLGATFLFFP